MKLKKMILITVAMIALCTGEALAENEVTISTIDYDTNMLTVSGKTNEVGESVSVLLTLPGTELDKIVKEKNVLKQQSETISDSLRAYTFNLNLNETDNDVSGEYNLYLKTDTMSEVYYKSIYYAVYDERKNIIDEINAATKSKIEEKINDYFRIFGLEDFEPVKEMRPEAAAEALFRNKPYNHNDSGKLQNIIMESAILDCLENEKSEIIFDNNYFIKYIDIIGLDSLDAQTGGTLNSIYNNITNKKGRESIIEYLCGKEYGGVEELKQEFAKAVMIYTIGNSSKMGNDYISDLITLNNAKAAGMNAGEYINSTQKSRINMEIGGGDGVESLKELEDLIHNIIVEINKDKSGSSDGGKPTSSGGVVGYAASQVYEATVQGNNDTMHFSDISEDFWGYEAIYGLYNKGVISGYEDKSFKPQDFIKREEAVKMICVAFEVKENNNIEIEFSDVITSAWYYPYIKDAFGSGIVAGISEERFGIGEYISRQDLAVILYRIIGNEEEYVSEFSDQSNIADYALSAVSFMREKRIISGYEDNTFRPVNNITRAEAAVMIYKCLEADYR